MGRRTTAPPHAGSLPALRLLRCGRFLGGLGFRLRVLRGLLLPRAEGHGLDAERQDSNAARVDLPGLARLILVVRPGFALHAADDQYAHAFLVQVLPVRGVAVPDFHRRPEAAAILEGAILLGNGVVEIDVQAQKAGGLVVAVGELPVLGGRTDVALARKMRAHVAISVVVEIPAPGRRRARAGVPGAITDRAGWAVWT